MSASTKATDRGYLRIEKELRLLDGQSIKVGIQADSGSYPTSTSMVMVAAYNEFGTDGATGQEFGQGESDNGRIPSRPFMRVMASKHRDTLYKVAVAAYEGLLKGGNAARCLGVVGTWYQDTQKKVLRDGPWKPNAPMTIRLKRSATPLIDTARLVNSIRYVIVSGRPRS